MRGQPENSMPLQLITGESIITKYNCAANTNRGFQSNHRVLSNCIKFLGTADYVMDPIERALLPTNFVKFCQSAYWQTKDILSIRYHCSVYSTLATMWR